MEIDKFTIIQRDNLTIACAALYPFPEEKSAKWPAWRCIRTTAAHRAAKCCLSACGTGAPDGSEQAVVLTTRSIHWFQERGFTPVDIDSLPERRKRCTTISAFKSADGRPGLMPSPPGEGLFYSVSKMAFSPLRRSVRVAMACASMRSSAYSDRRFFAR
jgi:hypothetical protein